MKRGDKGLTSRRGMMNSNDRLPQILQNLLIAPYIHTGHHLRPTHNLLEPLNNLPRPLDALNGQLLIGRRAQPVGVHDRVPRRVGRVDRDGAARRRLLQRHGDGDVVAGVVGQDGARVRGHVLEVWPVGRVGGEGRAGCGGHGGEVFLGETFPGWMAR